MGSAITRIKCLSLARCSRAAMPLALSRIFADAGMCLCPSNYNRFALCAAISTKRFVPALPAFTRRRRKRLKPSWRQATACFHKNADVGGYLFMVVRSREKAVACSSACALRPWRKWMDWHDDKTMFGDLKL